MAAKELKIAFVGRYYWHNGSSHALLGYHRAGQRLGYDVRVSEIGIVDDVVRQMVPVADREWKPDVLVAVFEERFLRIDGFEQIERVIPRERRLVIDPDGKYFDRVFAGTDTNHEDPQAQQYWKDDFDRISETVLQPCLGEAGNGAQRFLYFGVDVHRHRDNSTEQEKIYDIVYVGNNWYRWPDIAQLLDDIADVRSQIGRIAIFGQYWNGVPLPGYEEQTYSDSALLEARGVETYPPVPFDSVEPAMGSGRFSPLLVRPILNELKLITPRMFETFAACTVPLLPGYLSHLSALYGPDAARLMLSSQAGHDIVAMLGAYGEYSQIARDIRARLDREHNYEVRLRQLVDFVS